ncbi:MAG: CHAT domain-containing protein [Muribaculaceae bacterium]|nr:CHAT domain-containing protein [Muribaculaceae bacterium]
MEQPEVVKVPDSMTAHSFKHILTVLLILCAFSLQAQDESHISLHLPRQEKLFQKGINLFNDGKYEESLPYFNAVIQDDEVYDNRYQLIIYASMWMGNALEKMNRSEDAFNYGDMAILYSTSRPFAPDDMTEIDSLSHIARYYYDYYTDENFIGKALYFYKERQRLLENAVGKNHLWANGGRQMLISSYRRYVTEKRWDANANFGTKEIVAYTDTIARLGYDMLDCLRVNFADDDNPFRKKVYYCELMAMLKELHSVPYINSYHDISFQLINEINRLVTDVPDLTQYYDDHFLNIGKYLSDMSNVSQADGAPPPKYALNGVDLAQKGATALRTFIDSSPLAQADYRKKYEALSELRDIYFFLALEDIENAEKEEGKWDVDDFKYDFYNLEEAPDSVALAHYTKVNDQGLRNFLVEMLTTRLNEMVVDCTYDDLQYYEKKLIDVWEETIDLLRPNDFQMFLEKCCINVSPYSDHHLLKKDLNLLLDALSDYENNPELSHLIYIRAELLYRIVKILGDLSEPLYHSLLAYAKRTSTKEEMAEYLKLYLRFYEKYDKVITSYRQDIEKLDNYSRDRVFTNYCRAQCDFAEAHYHIASFTGKTENYATALKLLDIATSNEFYQAEIYDLEREINDCKIHIGNSEGYAYNNKAQKAEFEDLLTTFKYATADQRKSLWSKFMTNLDNNLTSGLLNPEDGDAGILLYNSLLYKKGILLASDKNFIDILSTSDETASDFLEKRKEFMNLLTDRDKNADALAKLERELQPYVRSSDYNDNLKCDWEEIRASLETGQSAVEFGAIISLGGRHTLFATVINNASRFPAFIPIGEFKDIDPLDITFVNLIKDKLFTHLSGTSTVFFSPDGFIYNTPIEHLIDDGRKWIRLSSTRQLKSRTNISQPTTSQIALLGGLDYDANISSSALPTVSSDKDSGETVRQLPENMRSGANNLPYTLSEVTKIDSIAKARHINTKLLTGKDGTEAAFTTLISRTPLQVLHFATHGFYFTSDEYKSLFSAVDNEEGTDGSSVSSSSDALSRCGLLLTGANKSLRSGFLTSGKDDGILTGTEVENLNLNNIRLLVLSACQTGLGDISADGVFGLQRGFKKAGANAILMSLWKVDDRATQLLMTKFYDEFLAGKPQIEALGIAQQYVKDYEEVIVKDLNGDLTPAQRRQMERRGETIEPNIVTKVVKPFADPRFWAAFVILDAI